MARPADQRSGQAATFLRQANHLTPRETAAGDEPWRLLAICTVRCDRGAQRIGCHRTSFAGCSAARSLGAAVPTADVWMVESNPDLRNLQQRAAHRERACGFQPSALFCGLTTAARPDLPPGLWSSDPVGIVYHTTESHGAPFEPEQNQVSETTGAEPAGIRARQAGLQLRHRPLRARPPHRGGERYRVSRRAFGLGRCEVGVYRPECQLPRGVVRRRDRRT